MLESYLAQMLEESSDKAEELAVEETQCFVELEDLKRLYYQEKRYLQQIEQQRYITSNELPRNLNDFAPFN
jgi:DNA primase